MTFIFPVDWEQLSQLTNIEWANALVPPTPFPERGGIQDLRLHPISLDGLGQILLEFGWFLDGFGWLRKDIGWMFDGF